MVILGAVTLLAAYLFGAFPTAYLAGRLLLGRDIRAFGSGNAGALNVYRALGRGPGAAVLAADIAKGAAVMLGAMAAGAPDWAMYGAAVAAVAGHNWPVYLRFHGGKGAAVMAGVSLVVLPGITLLAFPVVVVAYLATRSALWSLFAGFAVLNALTIITGQSLEQVILCLGLTFMVMGTHMVRAFRALWPAVKALDFQRIGEIE